MSLRTRVRSSLNRRTLPHNTATTAAERADRHELVFVDTGVADYQQLVDHLLTDAEDPDTFEIYLLDSHRDGVEQISNILTGDRDVDAIHIISHGTTGALELGSTWLNAGNLSRYEADIRSWGTALKPEADVLIYGCDVAANEAGRTLTDLLAAWTGADVAASSDATGAQEFGGDWDLEFQTGDVQATAVFRETPPDDWHSLLGVITVSTTNDVLDGDTSSVTALLGNVGTDGFISLREAIIATNNSAGADTIFLPTGTFTLHDRGPRRERRRQRRSRHHRCADDYGRRIQPIHYRRQRLGSRVARACRGQRRNHRRHAARRHIVKSQRGGGVLVDFGAILDLSRVIVTGNTAGNGAGILQQRDSYRQRHDVQQQHAAWTGVGGSTTAPR